MRTRQESLMKFLMFVNQERALSYVGIVLGFTVSLILTSKDEYFLPNFAFYWGSQLVVLALIFLFRSRPAIVLSMSFVVAIILLGFRTWVINRSHSNTYGLVWLLYLVLLFGAAIGGLGATWWSCTNRSFTYFQVACIVGIAAIGGSGLSITLACNTGLYCH